jgi:hypothetical protein
MLIEWSPVSKLYAPLHGICSTQKEEITPEGVMIEHKLFSDGNLRYVIATAHFDREELSGGGSGWSECAEKFLIDYIEANAGSAGYTVRISKDYAYSYNRRDYADGIAIGLHAITIRKSVDDYCKYMEGMDDNELYHVYLNNGSITYIC